MSGADVVDLDAWRAERARRNLLSLALTLYAFNEEAEAREALAVALDAAAVHATWGYDLGGEGGE